LALPIRKLGDPVLREKCREVEEVDDETRDLIREMGETLKLAAGHGLAAPQVGAVKRLFVYDAGHGPRCIVNPEIVEATGEDIFEEGCLSLRGVQVPIVRPSSVRVRCTTPSGQRVVIEPGGFLSRVFQHEIDHLEGVLIIDRCDEEERKRALAEYQELELLRSQGGA
jgi:peptide deformylase